MVRTRGRDGSIVRRDQPRRGVPTSLHGELAINLGRIPYSGLSPLSNEMVPIPPPRLLPSPHPPLTHQILLPPFHPPPTMHLHFLPLLQPYHPTILTFHHPLIPPLVI